MGMGNGKRLMTGHSFGEVMENRKLDCGKQLHSSTSILKITDCIIISGQFHGTKVKCQLSSHV